MKSGLYAIMFKELKRFFTDRRMVLTTVLLPGLMIFLIYSLLGSSIAANLSVGSDYQPQIYALNLPDSLQQATVAVGLEFTAVEADELEGIQERIAVKEADLLVIFPEDFDAAIGAQDAPNIELFYNSTRVESSSVYGQMQALLSQYKDALQPLFVVNSDGISYDLASNEDTAGFLFASLLPMLLMIFLYSGCLSVAPESIAGEKERGTIATLLVTPLKRWELALGKVLSLGIIALLAGASSFVGTILALPNLLQIGGGAADGDLEELAGAGLYTLPDYLMLLAIILSTVLLFIGIISVISAFARTIKEANTAVMPVMMVVLLVAATAMFQTSSQTNIIFYLVPVYNSVQSMVSVFAFAANPLAIALTVLVNLGATALCVLALTKMFESERVIFSR